MTVDMAAEARLVQAIQRVWASLTPPEAPLDAAEIAHLVAVERNLRRGGRWVSGPSTLFEALRYAGDEVRNCRVIRWILDPLAPHRLGRDVLVPFLADLADLSTRIGQPVAFESAEDSVVRAEVTKGSTRADLIIDGPSWTVVIEAKIYAPPDGPQLTQLAAEWGESTLVFLTRRGVEMPAVAAGMWLHYTWDQLLAFVAGALDAATAPSDEAGERARRGIADYLFATRGLRR